MKHSTNLTYFDEITIPWPLQLMKAMLPFLTREYHTPLGILVRIIELNYTYQYLSHQTIPGASTPDSLDKLLDNDSFLTAISPWCPSQLVALLRNRQLMSALDSISHMADLSDPGNLSNLTSMFSSFTKKPKEENSKEGHKALDPLSFLNDSQRQQYKDFLNQLNHNLS